MKTKVYSVFPACGKTWLCEHQKDYNLKILDCDSSGFNWIYISKQSRMPHPNFPYNYITHIKTMFESGLYDCIFVSSHASVREGLDKEGIDFTIVYPESSCKAEWVGRAYIRDKNGESGCGPKAMNDNWEQWISECVETGINHEEIVLKPREHLSDYF